MNLRDIIKKPIDYLKSLGPWKAASIVSVSIVSIAGIGYIIYRY